MIRRLTALFRRPAALTSTRAHQAVVDGAVLLDVRERDEWRAGHAPQARHVVLSQLEDHLADLPADRPIVTVCRSG
ncbi:rhodanese-like domain-containing protein, partial [Pseudomonas aeruginosa]|uniref:rhodanese-like domain-containing protein n=1 Tax=Pseudomonas aeruginosa TaxID=287 RepID=UPI002885CD4F